MIGLQAYYDIHRDGGIWNGGIWNDESAMMIDDGKGLMARNLS